MPPKELNFRKTQKIKANQEAFHSFSTHEEEKITQNLKAELLSSSKNQIKSKLQLDNDLEESEDDEYDLNSLKTGNPTDKIAEIALNLILKKKIAPQNSFEIPIFNIKEMTDFQNFSQYFDWKKLSFAMEAVAEIYGHRVDLLHMNTIKIINNLIRTYFEQNPDNSNEEFNRLPLQVPKTISSLDSANEKFLEKNIEKLNAEKYDLEFDIDPLFSKTSAKFDESASKALLLNNLIVNKQLKMEISSTYDISHENHTESFNGKQISYQSLSDLSIVFPFASKEHAKIKLCENMDNLINEMAAFYENMEKPPQEEEAEEEIDEEIPLEDPFYLNPPELPEENEPPEKEKRCYVEEPIKVQKTSKKKTVEKPLILEQIESHEKMIGIGQNFDAANNQDMEYLKYAEPSGNSKRKSRNSTKANFQMIKFDLNEKEKGFFSFKKEKKEKNFEEVDFQKHVFLVKDSVIQNSRFEKTFLRNYGTEAKKLDSKKKGSQKSSESDNDSEKNFENQANYMENEENLEDLNENSQLNDEKFYVNIPEKMENEDENMEESQLGLAEKLLSKENRNGRPVRVKPGFNNYISMKQLKNRVFSSIHNYYLQGKKNNKILTFSSLMQEVHTRLTRTQREIVNANLVFLSLLHLANEKNFLLQQNPQDPDDFFIIFDESQK